MNIMMIGPSIANFMLPILALGAGLMLGAPIAAAQGAPAIRQEVQQAVPATDAARPARRRTQDSRDGAFMGGGMVVPSNPSLGTSLAYSTPAIRPEIAPMPNLGLEAPRGFRERETARVTPSMIGPRLPGRGAAQETGSPGSLQDRLFRPAPGAHLRIPMSW